MIYNFKSIVSLLFYTSCIFFISCERNIDVQISDPYTISVTGSDYHWYVVYPGEDQILNTADDIEHSPPIYLPAKTNVNILLNSTDYLYFFEVPYFNQIGIAVPDKSYSIHFKTPRPESIEFKGNQMCGYTHQSLFGELEVLSKSKFKKWELNNKQKHLPKNVYNEKAG